MCIPLFAKLPSSAISPKHTTSGLVKEVVLLLYQRYLYFQRYLYYLYIDNIYIIYKLW